MDARREAYLLRLLETQATVAECRKFREELAGEELTTALYAALLARMDMLQKRGAL